MSVERYHIELLSYFYLSSLVNAPRIDALEIVEKLTLKEEKSLRLALFALQKHIRVRSVSLFSQVLALLFSLRKLSLLGSFLHATGYTNSFKSS